MKQPGKIQAFRLTVFRAFEAFPPGTLRTFHPICSIVSVGSFPYVGQRVGQKMLSEKIVFSRSVTPCAD